MIQLRTLGDTAIVIGDKELRPTSPKLFGAVLYLAMEAGRRVPRTELQELLFGESADKDRAHSLRQILYRARQFGAPLQVDDAWVCLPADAVANPLSRTPLAEPVERLALGFLPGYAPRENDAFSRWVEATRDAATVRIISDLRDSMATARAEGDHAATRRIASALLALDPFNEDATLAKAESLALAGSMREAVRVLEAYEADVGSVDRQLGSAAQRLRRRIGERADAAGEAHRPALVGRARELAWLNAQHRRAAQGQSTVSIVWGDAGIGKTRLAQEFAEQIRLRDTRIVTAQCQPHDSARPLGAVSDMVPQLLRARGALGASPESLEWLKRLDGSDAQARPDAHPEYVTAQLRSALADLLGCVASEGVVVLVVEDTHWLDEASARFLLTVVPAIAARLHVVLTRRPDGGFFERIQLGEHVFVTQLQPLEDAAAAELLQQSARGATIETAMRDECLRLAAGNPLFLRSIASHLQLRGTAPLAHSGLTELLLERVRILDPASLLLLRSAAVLGALGTFERIRDCSGQATDTALIAMQTLTERGLLQANGEHVRCSHDLLAEATLSETAPAVRSALHERAAARLESEGTASRETSLLWSCAEHWQRANRRQEAVASLRRCAALANELGQPRFSCDALERAVELCDRSDLAEILAESIRIAHRSYDSGTVLRHVPRYRDIAGTDDRDETAQFVDLAEISARRRQGHDVGSAKSRLLRIMTTADASMAHRRSAAKLFALIDGDYFSLETRPLESLYRELWHSESDDLDALVLRQLFQELAGDLGDAAVAARLMLARIPTLRPPESLWMLAAASTILFAAGDVEESIELTLTEYEQAKTANLPGLLFYPVMTLTLRHFALGDLEGARRWNDTATRLFAADPGHRVLAGIAFDLAYAAGDLDLAETLLAESRTLHTDSRPTTIRTHFYMELFVAAARGTLDPAKIDLRALKQIDEAGGRFYAHTSFAIALYLAQVAAGEQEEAESRLFDFFHRRRRERYDPRAEIRVTGLPASVVPRILDLYESAVTVVPISRAPSYERSAG